MARSVYLETSIISYLAARPSRDLVTAARQQVTREWWARRRASFVVYGSEAVVAEVRVGDRAAATRRTEIAAALPLLEITPETVKLARAIASMYFGPGYWSWKPTFREGAMCMFLESSSITACDLNLPGVDFLRDSPFDVAQGRLRDPAASGQGRAVYETAA